MVISTTDSKENQSKKLCYIYRHIRLDRNEVFYIGKGTNTNGRYSRSNRKDDRNTHWERIVKKHGYKVEIVVDKLTEEDANKKEVELILLYGRIDLGTGTLVNMTAGGEGLSGYKRTPESIEKTRRASIGRKRTPEQIEELRKINMGHTYNLGRKQSKDHIEKRRKANSGKKRTPEQIEKTRQANIGKKRSLEVRMEISSRQIRKRVGQYKEGVLIKEYPSLKSVDLDGFINGCVSQCCHGHRKYHHGFEWKFI